MRRRAAWRHRMPPLVADLGPSAPGGDDDVVVESFVAAPRTHAETEGGEYLLPSSAVVESAKDKAMAVMTTMPPGPRQATLGCVPPFSGPMPAKLDESGCFPLAMLAERRAKEQLANISLLRSSVEYALADAAREVATLERELDAAKG